MHTHDRLRRNIVRALALSFFQRFMLVMPIVVVLFESRGVPISDVLLLQAWFAALVVVLEVPSGYVADLFGRRGAMILGGVFLGLGNTWLVFAHGFWQLALFEACLAVAFSLISGADLALLYDTELALAESAEQKQKAVRRLYFAGDLAEALAAFGCSVLVVFLFMDAVVWAQAACGWLPLLLAFTLAEPPRERLAQVGHGRNFALILRALLLDNRILRLTFLALAIWGLTTMYAVWLLQAHWQAEGVGLVHFGYLWGALTLLSAVAGRYALLLEDRLGTTTMLAVIGLGPVLGYLAMGLLGTAASIAMCSVFFACRGFGAVILRDALNRRVGSDIRATANSLSSFGFRAAFALTAPLVGGALDLWGLPMTLLLLAAASFGIFVTLIVPLIVAARQSRGLSQIHSMPPEGSSYGVRQSGISSMKVQRRCWMRRLWLPWMPSTRGARSQVTR